MKKDINCPNDNKKMKIRQMPKSKHFRGVDIEYEAEEYVCPECGLEVADRVQAGKLQRAISDAYRSKVKLLTSVEIVEGRKRLGVTQDGLAKLTNIGVASIKRWEKGLIQTRPMDEAIRKVFQNKVSGFTKYQGNRELSNPRVKRVAKEYEQCLGRDLLGGGVLHAGKYFWYADMVAFRELSKSMTGATYAALPKGPQLDNYIELADEIREADQSKSEPLTDQEKAIIQRIANRFTTDRSVYNASHREEVWKKMKDNDLIGHRLSYLNASKLTEI